MTHPLDEGLERAKEGAFREVAAVDAAHARGELDDAGWHRAMAAIVVPAYLRASTVQGGSGHGGTLDDWEHSRGIVAEALERHGTFLDIGCANGLLMESVERWAAARGLRIEAHGLDISHEMAERTLERVPAFAGRIHAGNALGFRPARRFDVVRTGLEYVPPARRRALVAWLLDEVVAEGGRLVIGKYNEELSPRSVELALQRWGFLVSGRAEREHRGEPRLCYRALWIDAPSTTDGELRLRAMRESDLPRFTEWLRASHVARWWPPALDLAGVRARYAPRLAGNEATYMLVIEERAEPVGWIQWYRWSDYPEHAARLGAEPTAAGLDLGIGDADRIGRGLGPRAIRLLVERVVFADPSITSCMSDPHVHNAGSLRAFEKAGFQATRPAFGDQERCVVRRQR